MIRLRSLSIERDEGRLSCTVCHTQARSIIDMGRCKLALCAKCTNDLISSVEKYKNTTFCNNCTHWDNDYCVLKNVDKEFYETCECAVRLDIEE